MYNTQHTLQHTNKIIHNITQTKLHNKLPADPLRYTAKLGGAASHKASTRGRLVSREDLVSKFPAQDTHRQTQYLDADVLPCDTTG